MAKNFGSAGSARTIKDVAKASAEKAQVITVKMIKSECLVDYPKNYEDVQDTADLENSIKELGFTDPLEVTAFEQKDGVYMIVSGHRRRSAGVKCGITIFPCIVKSFRDELEVNNYALLANSQRDSAKDPLLFCKRYKMHEEYLKAENFDGKVRDEIAKRLGVSVAQADRYNTMNKVISPVWDMIRNELVGMSSVMPLASHTKEEQAEIYEIMQEAQSADVNLTRDVMKQIVERYREGQKTWEGIANENLDEVQELKENDSNVSEEVENGFVATGDKSFAEGEEREVCDGENSNIAVRDTAELNSDEEESREQSFSSDEKQDKAGLKILTALKTLNTYFYNQFSFKSGEESEEVLRGMSDIFTALIEQMYSRAEYYGFDEHFNVFVEGIAKKIDEYEKCRENPELFLSQKRCIEKNHEQCESKGE